MDLETQIDLDITAYVWDIQNGTFSDYDLSEYRRICTLTKGLEKPSPRMLQFLARGCHCRKRKVPADENSQVNRRFSNNIGS